MLGIVTVHIFKVWYTVARYNYRSRFLTEGAGLNETHTIFQAHYLSPLGPPRLPGPHRLSTVPTRPV